ncbi:MAG: glycine zipper 2TM domain-containing protein [Caldimonas sp.]
MTQPQAGTTAYAAQPQYVPPAQGTSYAVQPQYQPVPAVRQGERVVEAQVVARNHIGSIESIEPVRDRPQGTGAGAVIGGVLGAVVGNQFGHGTGRAAMTGVGAVGGALAGNNVERNYKEGVIGYRVNIRLDDGQTRTFERSQVGDLHVGDRVHVDAGAFHRV